MKPTLYAQPAFTSLPLFPHKSPHTRATEQAGAHTRTYPSPYNTETPGEIHIDIFPQLDLEVSPYSPSVAEVSPYSPSVVKL